MRVTVKLQGAVRAALGRDPSASFELALPDQATVGDLLLDVANRFGGSLREAVEAAGQELPSTLRVFVNGDLALRPSHPLLSNDAASPQVIVVIMSPMMGGGG